MKSATELNVEVMELKSRNVKLIQALKQKNVIISQLQDLVILAESRMDEVVKNLKDALKEA